MRITTSCQVALAIGLVLIGIFVTPAWAATAADTSPAQAGNFAQWFSRGEVSGNLRWFYYNNRNAYFIAGSNRKTAALGGKLVFTTAELDGFSMRLGVLAQQNLFRGEHGHDRDLGADVRAVGEAWLQWRGQGFQVRAGNQQLQDVPFAGTYDFVVVPQVYQGVKVRYSTDHVQLTGVRVLRYKSRIADGYSKHTNYNPPFIPFPPNAGNQTTDGFWAVGGSGQHDAGPLALSGKLWYVDFIDYARMVYMEGKLARAQGSVRPFVAFQVIDQTDAGRAIMGQVDSRVYGMRLGVQHGSLTVTLNFNLIPHRPGTFGNGSLVTPYATHESSGPLFAQPLLTSTQDLGSGRAWSLNAGFAPGANTFVGARYSRMDLTTVAGSPSIGQNGYMVFGIYHFQGMLKGLSLRNFFAYQTQAIHAVDYWENRLSVVYNF